jgi:hypothetical protein
LFEAIKPVRVHFEVAAIAFVGVREDARARTSKLADEQAEAVQQLAEEQGRLAALIGEWK